MQVGLAVISCFLSPYSIDVYSRYLYTPLCKKNVLSCFRWCHVMNYHILLFFEVHFTINSFVIVILFRIRKKDKYYFDFKSCLWNANIFFSWIRLREKILTSRSVVKSPNFTPTSICYEFKSNQSLSKARVTREILRPNIRIKWCRNKK